MPMDGPLEPTIIEILEKSGDMSLSVQKIAELIGEDTKACHVARVCGRLMREGRAVLTRTRDESGRGPFFKLGLNPVENSVSPKSEIPSNESVSPKLPEPAKVACPVCGMMCDPRGLGPHKRACKVKEIESRPGSASSPLKITTIVLENRAECEICKLPTKADVLNKIEDFARGAGYKINHVEIDASWIKLILNIPADKMD